jgi:hypothetical protein
MIKRAAGLLVSIAALAASSPALAGGLPVAHPRTHGPDPAVAGMRAHAAAAADRGEPAEWCGAEQSVDETSAAVDNGVYRYHAIYLTAADGQTDFQGNATQIQADAFGASGLIEELYGRAIRFDMGTSCGPGFLDITALRTSLTSRAFARAAHSPDGTLKLVKAALAASGFATLGEGDDRRTASSLQRNYVVWLDAPSPAGACGVADVYDDATRSETNWNNYGGKVAVVFHTSLGFCGAATVRHEIGHTLGALQSQAPNSFDGMHCDDAYEDTMCYSRAPERGDGDFEGEFFDYGNDDYWDPPSGQPLAWWTVNLNRFLCDTAACNVAPSAAAAEPSAPQPAAAQVRKPRKAAGRSRPVKTRKARRPSRARR